MSVYDRWHKSHPGQADTPCKCGRGKNKLYPTADHGRGKRWQVRWRDNDGKGCKRNFTEKHGDDPEKHAEAFDAQVNAQLDAGTYIDPERGRVTLERWAKEWRAGLVADPSTLMLMDKHLAHIYDVEAGPKSRRAPGTSLIGPMPMGKLSKNPRAIQQWIKSLEAKGLGAAYVCKVADTLSSIFIAAIDNGMILHNPVRARSVRLPTIEKKIITPWTTAMLAEARTCLEEAVKGGAMVDLGAGAGLRQGEIFGIAETDITFLGRKDDRKIRVVRQVKVLEHPETGKPTPVFAPPKGGKQREVPLSDALGRRLAAHIKAHPPTEVTLPWKTADSAKQVTARLLFVRADGRPWTGGSFIYRWHKARRAAGAPETPENGLHVLRHSYASVQLAAGVDVLKLALWLGHEDPSFTYKKYGHFIPDWTDKGRTAVDAFLEPAEDGQSALDVPSEGPR